MILFFPFFNILKTLFIVSFCYKLTTMESLIIDLVDYSFSTFLRYLVDLIPVGRLLMFRKHIDQHHVSEFLFFFSFFFLAGVLFFLLIFFNVLMMYKNIFFYTFRNFLEFAPWSFIRDFLVICLKHLIALIFAATLK